MLRTLLILLLVPMSAVMVWLGTGHTPPRADFVVASSEPRTIDPHRVSWIPEIQIANALFEGLTRLNANTLLPEPAVAEGWETDPAHRVWTFLLRADARWSNGDPVVAEDFRCGWLRVLEPKVAAQYASLLFVIEGAEAYYHTRTDDDPGNDLPAASVGVDVLGPRELRVRLVRPCSYFLDLTAFPTFAPAHPPTLARWAFRDGKVLRETQHLWLRPGNIVCNGAFVITDWRFKQHIRLERNPYYWDRAGIGIDTLEIYSASDPNVALVAYETGRVDLVRELPPLVARALHAAQVAGKRSDFHLGPRFATFFYRVNCQRPPLDDPDLRRALALAIDRTAICTRVMGLGETPARTYVPPHAIPLMPREDPAGRPVLYQPATPLGGQAARQDRVALAREYLRRHLARRGLQQPGEIRPLEIAFAATPEQRRIAEAVQQMLEENLGLRIELRVMEAKVLSARIRQLDYDLARSNWFGDYMDPGTFLNMFVTGGGQNRTGWSHPRYDALVAAAENEANDRHRYALLTEAEAILLREVPIITVFHRTGNFLLRPGFTGLRDHVRDLLPIHRVQVGPEVP
jgi:oligopeptide transport system substrate-binding protein